MPPSLPPDAAAAPRECLAVIEIAAGSPPVRYELDPGSGLLEVKRIFDLDLPHPQNYGFVPDTLAHDGDPLDVVVVAPFPLLPRSVVRCRPVGLLAMLDGGRRDAKVIAVPAAGVWTAGASIRTLADLAPGVLEGILHFLECAKTADGPSNWRFLGWESAGHAQREIAACARAHAAGHRGPYLSPFHSAPP